MTKTELHRLVDALPEESLEAAAVLLRRAQDPVVAKLDAAPYDDEELSEEELAAVRGAPRASCALVRRRGGARLWLIRAVGGSKSAPQP
jgi:hypothetical protein